MGTKLPSKTFDGMSEDDKARHFLNASYEDETPSKLDWVEIDCALIKHFNFRPWELEDLSITEIWLLWRSLKDTKNEDATNRAVDEAVIPALYNRLSPAEKLDLAMLAYPS